MAASPSTTPTLSSTLPTVSLMSPAVAFNVLKLACVADVYAVEVAAGGDACVGPIPEVDGHEAGPLSNTATAAAASTVAGTATSSAGQSCRKFIAQPLG